MDELSDRRSYTARQIVKIRKGLKTAEGLAKGKACAYVTGSFGRCEASLHSDLDMFILGKNNGKETPDGKEGSLLSRLDEICIKAELIYVTRQLSIKEFSGEGRYLTHYSVDELTKTLGQSDDDVNNTFTARLLLLLESKPLLEETVHKEAIRDVIAAYWRDYGDHKMDFIPAFLANDILRLWRTFCVNYEAGTEREPEIKKAKGKLKNYKLKHSRLLTYFSALLYLLAVYRRERTVHPTDALEMVGMTPTERLQHLLADQDLAEAHGPIGKLLQQYGRFLETTNADEDDLVRQFSDKEQSRNLMNGAFQFGDCMFEALEAVGRGNRFYRLLVV